MTHTRTFLTLLMAVLGGVNSAFGAKVLDTLIIEGLSINQPRVVRSSVGLRADREFTPADIQTAVRNLYRLGLFRSIDFYVAAETDSSASLLLKVEEYPICEAIEFSGNKKLKERKLEEEITLQRGQIATDELLFDNVQRLEDLYEEEGYLLADIQTELVETKVPGNAIVKFVIDEGKKVRVKEITFEGNQAFKDRKLARKFKTKEKRLWRSGEYDQEKYRLHLDSLVLWYNDQGYLDAEIVHDSVWFAENKEDIFIELELEEGEQYFVGDFYFDGNEVIESDSLRDKIALKEGKPFEKSKFDMTKFFIESAYREEGYLWVQVSDERSYNGDTIDVTFRIREGRPAIVRKVSIRGNNKTMDKVVRREVKLMPAEKYQQSALHRSVRDIMQLNYFDNVTPDLKPNEDGTIDLVFEVVEKDNIGQLSLGAAYSERDKFVGTFSTSIPNFRGTGQELNLNVEYGKNRQDYSIGFREPWAFDRPISLQGYLYYNMTRYSTGISESYGFRGGAGRRLKWPDDYFRIDGIYQLSMEQQNTETSFHPKDLMLPQDGYMSRLALTLSRNDTETDPSFPDRGSKFELTTEVAGLGGDIGDEIKAYKYLKNTFSYDWYFPLFWKFVLVNRSKFGMINKLPWSDELVMSRWDLFNAGGVWSDGMIRGYRDYAFGGHSNSPETGLTMLTLSTALRFPILERQLYLSVFGDMGNTWSSIDQVDLTDMYAGVGLGVRIVVPMLGLMGFDFAWKLDDPFKSQFENDPGTGADRFEFHFIMGQNRGF